MSITTGSCRFQFLVADLTELNKSTLYYYERVGIMLPVPRDAHGYRLYSDRHLEWVHFLKCMKKDRHDP